MKKGLVALVNENEIVYTLGIFRVIVSENTQMERLKLRMSRKFSF